MARKNGAPQERSHANKRSTPKRAHTPNMNKWDIRDASENDIEYIYTNWLKNFRHQSYAAIVQGPIYYDNYKKIIDHILLNAHTKVACLKENQEVILGFMTYQPKIIHYIYVKDPFRELGVAKSLYQTIFKDDEDVQITHQTKKIVSILRRKQNLVFNPFILFNKGES